MGRLCILEQKDLQRCGGSNPGGPNPDVATKSGRWTGPFVYRRTKQKFWAGKVFNILNICLYIFYFLSFIDVLIFILLNEDCLEEKMMDGRDRYGERCSEGESWICCKNAWRFSASYILMVAKQVISELQTDNQANRNHIRAMVGMFNVIAETNSALAQMW